MTYMDNYRHNVAEASRFTDEATRAMQSHDNPTGPDADLQALATLSVTHAVLALGDLLNQVVEELYTIQRRQM